VGTFGEPDTLKGVRPVRRGVAGNVPSNRKRAGYLPYQNGCQGSEMLDIPSPSCYSSPCSRALSSGGERFLHTRAVEAKHF